MVGNDSLLSGNESLLGKNPKVLKDIDSSSHYVYGEFVVTVNALICWKVWMIVCTFLKYI